MEAHQKVFNAVTRHSKASCVIGDGECKAMRCSMPVRLGSLGGGLPRRLASPKGGRVGIFEASAESRSTCHCVRGGFILVKEEPGRDIFV